MRMKKRKLLPTLLLFGFLLGVHNGRIALWKDDDPEPLRVFPYQVSLLPQKDQHALNQGIHIKDRNQLIRLLEDYLS